MLPLGALAAGFGLLSAAAVAQTPPVAPASAASAAAPAETMLQPISVKARVETDANSLRATTTRIGKGKQELRDIPQAMTVVTERLIGDRNLDDFKDVLRSTAGITFQAGETGEEDIRLRGFSLGQTGDIYVDGIRDAALYERDTFNNDRVEVLKGSASMLFGRGSTGGVVNQVNKLPFLMNQQEVTATIGSGNERRATADFNLTTGQDAALRLNAVVHEADNWGAKVRKKGVAPSLRWGIGTADEFTVSLYHLEFDNVPLYNHPWFIVDGRLKPTLPAKNFYGLDSDYNKGSATYATLAHTHRFADGGELTTRLRHGRYERELWASVIRFGQTHGVPTTIDNLGPSTIVTRSPKGRIGISETTFLQTDYSNRFDWLGKRHNLLTGIDLANEDADRNNNFAGPTSGLGTTVGTPNNGDSRVDPRGDPAFNTFNARSLGLYVQDTLELTPTVKLIGGLRYDHFKARYDTVAVGATPATSYSRSDSLWSPRLGALYQPNDWASYHVSFGTSYNTSGDTYQFAVRGPKQVTANTPPEKSRNLEVGGKFDLFERRLSLGTAVFYAEKYNERNTDPDSAATQELLSGKRHAAGMELDIAGRITPAWEAFLSYTWIPLARIDKSNQVLAASGGGAQVEGDRPGLTPKHSASLWTTYKVTPKLRVGGGLNYRGSQNPEGNRAVTVDSFVTADLMAEYTFTDRLSLKFNVANVTDELYADMLYRGFYGPGAPRTAQLTLKAKF
ncbi:MAG: TonB-dependent siderophore receptor [Burkholderiaceae bacterium]